MNRLPAVFAILLALPLLVGCMRWEDRETESFESRGQGLFIVNEGNFQYGNATLSYYDPASMTVDNEIFIRANGFKLGDVANSMTVYDEKGWICVNNSQVIFAIDLSTFREVGRIENLTSPRFIHFVSPDKAYVTQLYDNRIFIVNPRSYAVTGHIDIPDMTPQQGSTEQMVQFGKYVFVNCWSYQNRIFKIDTSLDRVVASIEVGLQPRSILIDRNGKLWALTDGGYEGSPFGYEAPTLTRIDAESMAVERVFRFRKGDQLAALTANGNRDTIYWINNDVWRMDVSSPRLPVRPFLHPQGTRYYDLTVNPVNSEVYVADAIDYQQQGIIYRYSPDAELIDQFYVGITPGAFAWK